MLTTRLVIAFNDDRLLLIGKELRILLLLGLLLLYYVVEE
jgi:hypothetical protein